MARQSQDKLCRAHGDSGAVQIVILVSGAPSVANLKNIPQERDDINSLGLFTFTDTTP